MKHALMCILLFSFATAILFPQETLAQEQQFQIPKSVIGSGGEAISDISFRLVGTVGQPLIGVASSSSNINQAGFWYQVVTTEINLIAGDVNADGLVNVQDLIRVINIILNIGPTPTEAERTAADLNGDGIINVTDLIGIINIILGIG